MSRTRFYEDKENINILNDISSSFDLIQKDFNISRMNNLSFDLNGEGFKDDEIRQLKKKNLYLQQFMSKIKDDKKMTSSAVDLVKENVELKSQRDQYLNQLKKNEEMLFKARELISHLKADIHLDNLSQNLFSQLNNSIATTPKPSKNDNEDRIVEYEKKIKELQKGLGSKDQMIEELKKNQLKLTTENATLQRHLTRAIEKIKKYKLENDNSKMQDVSILDYTLLQTEKVDLKKKLETTVQHNYDLFANYSQIMKENSDLQGRVFGLEQEVVKLKHELSEKNANLSVIRETESRVENLECNLSRMEDTKYLLPHIEEKVESMKKSHKEKIEILKYGVQLMNESLNKLLNLFTRNEIASFGDPFTSTSQSIFMSTVGDEKPTSLNGLINMTRNDELRSILEKMNINKVLKPILENMAKFIYSAVYEELNKKVNKKLTTLEKKISDIDPLINYVARQKKSNHPRSRSSFSRRTNYHQKLSIDSTHNNSFLSIISNNNF